MAMVQGILPVQIDTTGECFLHDTGLGKGATSLPYALVGPLGSLVGCAKNVENAVLVRVRAISLSSDSPYSFYEFTLLFLCLKTKKIRQSHRLPILPFRFSCALDKSFGRSHLHLAAFALKKKLHGIAGFCGAIEVLHFISEMGLTLMAMAPSIYET